MSGRLVGVTWGRDLVRRSCGPGENALRYLELVVRAGLTPVLLTPGVPNTVLDHLDGLLVPGGPDVSPATYGRQPAAELGPTDPDLDTLEIETIRAARQAGMPILGICRGQQVLNVALGGTLHQHVEHPQWGEDPSQPVHDLRLVDGSFLQRTLGGSAPRVNSGHHQAVELVAPSLRASAFSADGQVEALEAEELRILAVQWHPEEMPGDRSTQLLFEAFAAWVTG